jgi:hypothetical protein
MMTYTGQTTYTENSSDTTFVLSIGKKQEIEVVFVSEEGG